MMRFCPHCNGKLTRAGKDQLGRAVWECLNALKCKEGDEVDFIETDNGLLTRSVKMDDFGEVSYQIK